MQSTFYSKGVGYDIDVIVSPTLNLNSGLQTVIRLVMLPGLTRKIMSPEIKVMKSYFILIKTPCHLIINFFTLIFSTFELNFLTLSRSV